MEIRVFSEKDTQDVIDLWNRCQLTRPWNDPKKDISRKLMVQPELFFVGLEKGKIIASVMAGYDGHRGSIYYLSVCPDHQGQGYGKALMQTVEAELKARGCPKVNILVRSDNSHVVEFYQRLGYQIDPVVVLGMRLIADS